MKNKNYTVEQLLHDTSFIRWAKGDASPKEATLWDQWIKESERNRKKALAAQNKVVDFAFEAPKLPDVYQEWDKVQQEIIAKKQLSLPDLLLDRSWNSLGIFLKVAAVLLIGIFAGLAVYMHQQPAPAPQRLSCILFKPIMAKKRQSIFRMALRLSWLQIQNFPTKQTGWNNR